MGAKRFKFSAEFDEELFKILGRKDDKTKKFAHLAKDAVLAFRKDLKGYRLYPRREELKAMEDLKKLLGKIEKKLAVLHNPDGNDTEWFMMGIGKALREDYRREKPHLACNNLYEVIYQFEDLSDVLQDAATFELARWKDRELPSGGNKGKPAESLAKNIGLYFLAILEELPAADLDGKFARTVAHLLKASLPEKPDSYQSERFQGTLDAGLFWARLHFDAIQKRAVKPSWLLP